MTDRKSNIVVIVSTALFAVLSLSMMLVFKFNESYFDTHGKLGTLATNEQNTLLMETSSLESNRRSIEFEINDTAESKLILPLSGMLETKDISVREEFANNKLVFTLNNAIDLIEENTIITTDSSVMDAVGLYRQGDNIVLELYEKEPYTYLFDFSNKALEINLMPIKQLYDKTAVIYISYNQKDRLYSEEWISNVQTMLGDKVKVFLASTMREEYTQEQVCEFANAIAADLLIEISYQDTNQPEYMTITCNTQYFIPNFGNTDLAILERQYLEEKTGRYVAQYVEGTKEDYIVFNSRVPTAKATLYVQTLNETIEDKYRLNHSVMEAISSILGQTLQNEEQ